MTKPNKPKTAIAVAIVLILGAALGWGIVQRPAAPSGDEHGHGEHGHEHGSEGDEHADDGKHVDGHGHDGEAGHGDAGGEHAEQAPGKAPSKGPKGGKLFRDGDYALEVSIFEDGVPPEFRIHTYRQDKPLPAAQSRVQVTLERLGRAPQVIRFSPQGGYLKGDAEVVEPHSFKVTVEALEGGRQHRFSYVQEEARVTMSDAQLAQAGVKIVEAGPARIGASLELLGEVRYNADRTVQVQPRLAGTVEQVLVSAGQPVRKGQVLAVLSSAELADLRAQSLAASRRLELARATYEREKQLWEDKITARHDFLQAQTAWQEAEIADQGLRQKLANLNTVAGGGKGLTRYELRAPIDGVVTDRRISVGESVADNSAVFTVSDLGSVWVEAPVAAKDLPALREGQKVQVSASAFDAQAQGQVSHISMLLGEQTRTATVRVVLANPKGLWLPGLPVKVQSMSDVAEVPVAVRVDAIQSLRDWQVVFGRYGQQLEARPLKLGRSDGRMVEVISGLQAGERYAADNSFVIKAELGKAGASHDH